MKKQSDLFNAELSRQAKERGMDQAAANHHNDLELARWIATGIAKHGDGTCNADQVGRVLKNTYNIDSLGPAAGSIFRGKQWDFTGRFVYSSRVTNHSRLLRVWRYVG